jgi:hypothetical protein
VEFVTTAVIFENIVTCTSVINNIVS